MEQDLSQYGTVSAAPAAGSIDLSRYGSIAPATKRNGAGQAISGLAEGVGDVASGALQSLRHPIDALSSIWKGMQYEADRSAQSLNKGDLLTAAQHALGVFPVFGPALDSVVDAISDPTVDDHEMGKRIGSALTMIIAPDAIKKGTELTKAAAAAAPDVAAALKEGAKAAAPDVAVGTAKVGAGAAIAHFIPAGEALKAVLGLPTAAKGITQIGRGLKAGAAAYSEARAAQAAADAAPVAEAAAEPAGLLNAGPIITPPPEDPSFVRAVPARYAEREPPPPPRALLGAAPPAAIVTPPPADASFVRGEPQEWSPSLGKWIARGSAPETDLSGYGTVTPAPSEPLIPEPVGPPAPAIDPARAAQIRIEDAADQQAARMQSQAEDIIWANRAHRADRFAAYMLKNDMEPTPVNLARAAKEMAESGGAPSAETVDMIHDRMGYNPQAAEDATRARMVDTLAPAEAEAPTAFEKQLRDSIDAANARRVQSRGTANDAQQSATAIVQPGATGEGAALHASPAPVPGGAAEANRTIVDVPGEAQSYAGRYEVRELAGVQPSHIGQTFQPNPAFEYENDRNYDDPVNQRKIVDWSAQGPTGFKARNMINTAPDASSGPPVIDSRGNVLGGNGRTMILQRVYGSNPEGAAAYRAELDRTAAHFGFDPASYAGMKQPVLVRTLDDAQTVAPGAAQKAVTDFNKVGTAALTPSERAIADAHGVSLSTLDDISARMDREGPDATLNQTLDGKNGVEVLQNLMRDGVISPQEGAALATENKLTRAGRERVSGLMLGRFFTNARQMDALPDAIRNKMERLAAPLARVEGSPDYSLSPRIREALDLMEDADAHGATTIDDQANQGALFGDRRYSPDAVALANQLKTRDPLALTNAIRGYAERSKYAGEYQGPGMFGDIPAPKTPGEAFDEGFGSKAVEAEAAAKTAKRAAAAKAKETASKAVAPIRSIGDLGKISQR